MISWVSRSFTVCRLKPSFDYWKKQIFHSKVSDMNQSYLVNLSIKSLVVRLSEAVKRREKEFFNKFFWSRSWKLGVILTGWWINT